MAAANTKRSAEASGGTCRPFGEENRPPDGSDGNGAGLELYPLAQMGLANLQEEKSPDRGFHHVASTEFLYTHTRPFEEGVRAAKATAEYTKHYTVYSFLTVGHVPRSRARASGPMFASSKVGTSGSCWSSRYLSHRLLPNDPRGRRTARCS